MSDNVIRLPSALRVAAECRELAQSHLALARMAARHGDHLKATSETLFAVKLLRRARELEGDATPAQIWRCGRAAAL